MIPNQNARAWRLALLPRPRKNVLPPFRLMTLPRGGAGCRRRNSHWLGHLNEANILSLISPCTHAEAIRATCLYTHLIVGFLPHRKK